MSKNVRLAVEADIPVLAKMLGELFSMDHEFKADLSKQEKGLRDILRTDVGKVFILSEGDVIIGMVSVLFSVSTALGGRVGILEDMYIREDKRGMGDGTLLLNGALRWCKDNGLLRVTLLTDFDNDRAIGFYGKNGFVKSTMVPLRLFF